VIIANAVMLSLITQFCTLQIGGVLIEKLDIEISLICSEEG
jgi:hypothetical protein